MAWRYTCNIPTYITGKDENGEPVVLYRVNVLFQQLGEDGKSDVSGGPSTDSAPFFILRRYSQFRHLHDQLKAAFPAAMSGRGMAPPPKHSLVLGDKRDALERRRSELERWLWRLVGTSEVARGPQLKAFLEFDKALARAQQQQARRRAEQSRLLESGSLPLAGHIPGGSGAHAASSEAGYPVSLARHHLGAYPGGAGGGGSVIDDDSGSEASAFSAAPSVSGTAGGAPPGPVWATSGGAVHGGAAVPARGRSAVSAPQPVPDPRVAPGHQHQQLQSPSPWSGGSGRGDGVAGGDPSALGGMAATANATAPALGGGGGPSAEAVAAGGTGAPPLARLGISLECRADVRRLVDQLVQGLEAACAEASAAAGEVVLLREANRDMAQRLGELELERAGEGPAAELRMRLAESESARTSLELRVAQLEEMLAGRGAAHAAQVSQLQAQLAESRSENGELLRRLAEWDVGGSSGAAAAAEAQAAVEEARQQAEAARAQAHEAAAQLEAARKQAEQARAEADAVRTQGQGLQQRLAEQEAQLSELQQQVAGARSTAEEQKQQAAEARSATEEMGRQSAALMERLRDLEQQLAKASSHRQQAEAAAAAATASTTSAQQHQQQQQAQLERARADNALLAQEVKRLRAAAAHDRQAAQAAAAASAAQLEALRARVGELEAAAAVVAVAPRGPAPAAAGEGGQEGVRDASTRPRGSGGGGGHSAGPQPGSGSGKSKGYLGYLGEDQAQLRVESLDAVGGQANGTGTHAVAPATGLMD